MRKLRKIGILTSGGDAPGMNAAIRAVVRTAIANGIDVVGINKGYSGLIKGDVRPLGLRDVSNVINKGGTILYSDRCPEFVTPEGQAKGVETCKKLNVDGIVALGGDGTFKGARALANLGISSVGIPCTIDNDITSTDKTIGFDTAMNTTLELVDKLRDTCESHARCNVIEVMGRGAGDIAIYSGLAAGATAIAVAEFPFDEEALFAKINASKKLGKRNFIVIVSEALGGDYGPYLVSQIENKTGVESRFSRPAHIVRGGSPTLFDRVLASKMGVCAVEELIRGKSNIVVCARDEEIYTMDISYALTLDRYFKGRATADELALFSERELAEMNEYSEKRRREKERLYEISYKINI
jgi:6-phosphofructokinase 1